MKELLILIIEDEVIMAMDIQRRLKILGYSSSEIKNSSDDALNYLKIHSPGLILCDINIYGEKDGIDVAAYVRDNKSCPLIFVTALSDRGTLERAKKTLPYGYIVKPFNNRDLSTAIELALYKHSVEVERLSLTIEKVNKIASTSLSEREFEILQNVIKGQTNNEIASSQFISLSTVKFHMSNILVKLNVKKRSEILPKIMELYM